VDELPLKREKAALGDQKAVDCHAQADIMMRAAPVTIFIVAKAELLLVLLERKRLCSITSRSSIISNAFIPLLAIEES
jgi:hypothetical protein